MKLLITAGPTREPIDAVRYISNRSSGRMGLALASAAMDCADITRVTLLAGPGVQVEEHAGDKFCAHLFETTADLQAALHEFWPMHDVLIMAAAVSDYRPAQPHDGKLPRASGGEGEAGGGGGGQLNLQLEPTPDLVAEMVAAKRDGQRVIGFALEEPAHLEKRAGEKLKRKGVDAIVANPLGTMDADGVEAVWLEAGRTGKHIRLRPMSKLDFARWLIERVIDMTVDD